jgi:hypothetical protein
MFETHTYKIKGRRISARTDAQAAFAKEAIERRAREARKQARDAKRIALDSRNIPGFKQKVRGTTL